MSFGVAVPVANGALPDVSNDGKIVEAHYDAGRKSFWMLNSRGGWIEVAESSLRRHLRGYGLRNKTAEGELLSELNLKINEIQTEHDVAYAGPLAGYRRGVIECFENRILVTTEARMIVPVAGEWPVLRALITNLLSDDQHDQLPYLYGWLKFAYEALLAEKRRAGPAMVLAGPRNCGKSLLQKLFTVIFGGRVAKPYRYMSGRTDFNAELFGAEHLMIEDETPSTDLRSRRNLGSHIKAFTVNDSQSCHGKGRQALTLSPFWRVSISVNDEPENLTILPPMDDSEQDSLGDKIILLRARKAEMPMPSEELDDRETFWRTLSLELPAFLHFLTSWAVPEELRHSRFGIRTWQHPALLAALDALAPETRLLRFIDEILFAEEDLGTGIKIKQAPMWEGTAEKLERRLRDSDFQREIDKLFTYGSACGAYLGRLATKHPERVRQARTGDCRKWILHRAVPIAAAA